MTLTNEQIEQLKVERLQKQIEGRPVPFFSAGNATANTSIDDDFAQPKVEVKPVTEPQQQRVDNDEAAESALTPEQEDELLITQALKNIAAEDRAALAFVQRHRTDYHATPQNGQKIFNFLAETGMDVTKDTLEFAFTELTKQGVNLSRPKKYRSGLPANAGQREPEINDDYVSLGEQMKNAPTLEEGRAILRAAFERQRKQRESF
jgi:hypothetical protein